MYLLRHQKLKKDSLSKTVLKFQDFSITQILGEINFRECRSSKSAIYNNFRGYQL